MSKREEKVFYNSIGVGHIISYSTDDNKVVKFDARSRWAYLIVNKKEAKELLTGEEKTKDEIFDKLEEHFFSYIEKAIKEEENLMTYYKLSNNIKYSDHKRVALVSSSNANIKKGKELLLQAKSYMKNTNTLKETYEQTVSLLEMDKEKAKQHLQEELSKNRFIKVTRATIANNEENQEAYALITLPYVYNFEDNTNINSKLIATIKKEDITASFIEAHNIEGKWTDENKKEILEYNISNKEDKVYFHIKTIDIPDGTICKLTIIDYDYIFDDTITSLNFTINNNEAFILIEFDKIKHNIIKAIKEEAQINNTLDETELINMAKEYLELYTIVEIKELNIKKELAKKRYLKTSTGYIKIGTRSLKNLPYPDSMPPISKFVRPIEAVLDKINLEPVHQHIAFLDDKNIGFTTAYEELNEDIKGDTYGMLKTDPEMSGIIDTKKALSKYAWDKYYCDEDTLKEAIYETINEHKYAVSDTIAQMNANDLLRKGRFGREITFTFTKIIRYTPQEGKRYSLLSENCQAFVQRVVNRYISLEKRFIKEEKL